MFRLIKIIFFVIIFSTFGFGAKLVTSPADERMYYLTWIEEKTGLEINQYFPSINKHIEVVKDQVRDIDTEAVIKQVKSGEVFQQAMQCGKTLTSEIKRAPSNEVYKWIDEQGRVHFGDKAPKKTEQTNNLSDQYKSKRQYFTLKVTKDSYTLPPFIEDRVSADVKQIYSILASDLNLDHLRQVFLNVRIIENQEDFQVYKNKMAPKLRTNSGFYTSKNNEAVVFQGKRPETMRAVVRHESSHVIMAGLYGYTPSWFNEGFAEYFERLKTGGQIREIEPASNHLKHLNILLKQPDLSLKRYLETHTQDWYAGNLQDNYALAWSIVYFLMSHEEGKTFLKGMLNQLAKNYCLQFSSTRYFENNYPGGLINFEQAWMFWLKREQYIAHRY